MKAKYLVPILAVLAMLLAGVGAAYTGSRTIAWNGQDMMSYVVAIFGKRSTGLLRASVIVFAGGRC